MDLARNLRVDSVSRLEPTPPHRVEFTQMVQDAVYLMRSESVGCLLVCQQGRLVGVFTERDLLCRVLGVGKALTIPIGDVMTAEPVTVSAKDSILRSDQKDAAWRLSPSARGR